MKIRELFEEAIPIVSADSLWQENADSASQYITTNIYQVKELESDGTKVYQVFLDKGGRRKSLGKVSQDRFDKSYTPVRGNQKPDAEGFIVYRDASEFEAFKYQGDTTKVELSNGTSVKLMKGDYILRQTDGDEFVYSVEPSKYFDQNYTKKT